MLTNNVWLLIDAAEILRHNRKAFEANVRKSIAGGSFDGVQYDNVLANWNKKSTSLIHDEL